MRFICSIFLLILLLLAEFQVAASLWEMEDEKASEMEDQNVSETDDQKVPVMQKPVSCPKPSSYDSTVLKQFVGKVLDQFQPLMVPGSNDEKIKFNVEMKMSESDLRTLSLYLANNGGDIYEVEEVLTSTLGDVSSHDKILLENSFSEKYFKHIVVAVMVITFVGFLAFSLTFMRLTFWIMIKWLLFLLFIVSFFWNWYFLYQENVSKYRTAIENGPPEKCKVNYSVGVWESLSSYFSEVFHVSVDECEAYHHITTISPAIRVPPTEALSFCIVNTFLKPLASLGKHMGLFLQELSQHIPFHLQMVALIFILIIVLFLIVIFNGYTVSNFLLILKPPTPQMSPELQDSREINEKLDKIMGSLEDLSTNDDVKEMRDIFMKSIKQILESKLQIPRIENSPGAGDAPG